MEVQFGRRRRGGEYMNKFPKREMIKTKSVYDPVEESDGFRVLIMRKWPRGIGYRKNNKRGD